MQETTVEDGEDEVISLLRQKHEIEMEEMKIKQAKEELTVRMQRANVSTDLLPGGATAGDSKAVSDHLCQVLLMVEVKLRSLPML